MESIWARRNAMDPSNAEQQQQQQQQQEEEDAVSI
jgi:hypothetical protein